MLALFGFGPMLDVLNMLFEKRLARINFVEPLLRDIDHQIGLTDDHKIPAEKVGYGLIEERTERANIAMRETFGRAPANPGDGSISPTGDRLVVSRGILFGPNSSHGCRATRAPSEEAVIKPVAEAIFKQIGDFALSGMCRDNDGTFGHVLNK